MYTETSFKKCFVNGRKAGVASYESGKNLLLYFSQSLGAGDFNPVEWQNKLAAEGKKFSKHQFDNAWVLPSADAAGIQAVIPGAEIWWEGSKEFTARQAAAAGSRKNGAGAAEAPTPAAPAAPAVASADTFQVPAVAGGLAGVLGLMPALRPVVDEWAAAVASAALDGSDIPGVPSEISTACALVPSLADHVEVYRIEVIRAAEEWKEKKAAEERAAAERLAALEAAKKAAESGKTLVKLADGSTVEVSGKVHPAFAEVLEDLKEYKSVYLYGPAGTGKSFMARQLAEALGVECHISGKSDLKYDLIGTYDASGKHIFTAFTRAWTEGGVWLWDEWDRSAADACTAINDALANGRLDIPGIGMVEKHKDFYCLAAGNTCGFGPDSKYAAAQKQDYSAGTRFLSKIRVDYCREMDEIVTNGDKELCDFAAAVRSAISASGIEIDLAIRTLKPLQTKAARRGCVRALECCLFAGLGKTEIRQLANRVNGSGKWFDALKELAA